MSDQNSYSDVECTEALNTLFPLGPAGADVLRELAPDGWERGSLLPIFHPSVGQLYEESLQIHKNIASLRANKHARPSSPAPTMEQIRAEFKPNPVDPGSECTDLVGMCLWDIFSDNHEVSAPDGRLVDLGSFRGSAGTIAEWIDKAAGAQRHDYMDFYMGTIWVARRADLTPVYRLIFERLQRHGFDWVYHFPRLGIVDLGPLREQLKTGDSPEWESYDPSTALFEEQRRESIEQMRREMDQAYREQVEAAANQAPPLLACAYREVYGRLPRGWPPHAEDE